jgi:hypothetical protein
MAESDVLDQFKLLQILPSELPRRLAQYITVMVDGTSVAVSVHKRVPFKCEIRNDDLERLLQRFLDGQLEEKEVNFWASIVVMMDDNFEIIDPKGGWRNSVVIEVLHILADRLEDHPLDSTYVEYLLKCLHNNIMPEL